jgi:hypothetical protein
MAFRFKSRMTGDVVMLEHNAKQLLNILGKDASAPGVLLCEDMPKALTAIEAAIAQDEADYETRKQEAKAKGEPEPEPERISLRVRTKPFVEMVNQCMKEKVELVWGV